MRPAHPGRRDHELVVVDRRRGARAGRMVLGGGGAQDGALLREAPLLINKINTNMIQLILILINIVALLREAPRRGQYVAARCQPGRPAHAHTHPRHRTLRATAS